MSGKWRTCKCGKRIFRDELAAKLFLALRKDSVKRQESRYYRCDHKRWHVTSKEGGSDNGRKSPGDSGPVA